MKTRSTRAWILAGSLIGLLLAGRPGSHSLAGAAGGAEVAATGRPARTLVYAHTADPTGLDVHQDRGGPAEIVMNALYDRLVENDNGEIRPQLAERWESSAGGTVWDFTLRRGVIFQDGTPLTAQAVKRSFDRMIDPQASFINRTGYTMIDKIEALDDYHARFTLDGPYSPFLYVVAQYMSGIISPAALDAGVDLRRASAGAGPFILRSWTPGTELVLERFEGYWGPPPGIDRIVIKIIPEASTRAIMVESGDAQLAFQVSVSDFNRLKDHPKVRAVSGMTLRPLYIGINCYRYRDARFRQALNYAVDKQAIVDNILMGLGRVGDALTALGTGGYSPVYTYPYDPGKARDLLQEAGIPEGFKLQLWVPQRYLMGEEAAQAVQKYLEEVGLEVELRVMEWGAYQTATSVVYHNPEKAAFDLFMGGWLPSTGDSDTILRPLFGTGGTGNRFSYSNPEVDKLLETGMKETNPEKRKAIYADAARRVLADAPHVNLHTEGATILMSRKVHGDPSSPLYGIEFRRLSLESPER